MHRLHCSINSVVKSKIPRGHIQIIQAHISLVLLWSSLLCSNTLLEYFCLYVKYFHWQWHLPKVFPNALELLSAAMIRPLSVTTRLVSTFPPYGISHINIGNSVQAGLGCSGSWCNESYHSRVTLGKSAGVWVEATVCVVALRPRLGSYVR